jgi:hypothetical protein
MAPARFTAPDGQVFFAEQDGEHFGFWLEGYADHWEASERRFIVGALASTLGVDIAHERLPDWMTDLAETVVAALRLGA